MDRPSLDSLAWPATLHCLAGCAVGEVLGMVIGTALGWGNFETIALAVVLAFFFGYALAMRPLLRQGMALAAAGEGTCMPRPCHNRLMPRVAKTLIVLVLAALLPLRAAAGVVIGYCAGGHQGQPAAAQAAHAGQAAHGSDAAHGEYAGHGAHAGHDRLAPSADRGEYRLPAKPVTPACGICAEHCASAGFATGGATQPIAARAPAQASPGDDVRAAPAFFPDQLDRPPLA